MITALFLEGPHGDFFRLLGDAVRERGGRALRVNLNGGDWFDWRRNQICYRGRASDWSRWIAGLMDSEQVTDLLVYGDWRPYHREAVLLANIRGIRIWAFDEGYLRPNWITMENGGVNGNSTLPHTPEGIEAAYALCGPQPEPQAMENPIFEIKRLGLIYQHMMWYTLLLFPFYRTHRPNSPWTELISGWIPRVIGQRKRLKRTRKDLERIGSRYFLFPLQLDADSQVRRYSPFSGMKEGIAWVITSFALHAPSDIQLVIKNHPLDSGLIRYDRFIRSFSQACGVEDRVVFLDGGNSLEIIRGSNAVVLLNSTMGIQAMEEGKAVYCLGKSIFSMPGLAVGKDEDSLDNFWSKHREPDMELLRKFKAVVQSQALINGNFYYGKGQRMAVAGAVKKLFALEAAELSRES